MKTVLFFGLFFIWTLLPAQTTLWATTTNEGSYGLGTLYRTDSIGNTIKILHHFDGVNDGERPGPIIQASNGKIYGMTEGGGHGKVYLATGSQGPIYTKGGTLYEYDPVIDSFKVLIHFDATDTQYPANFEGPSEMKLLEVGAGQLWCVFRTRTPFAGSPNRYVASYTIGSSSVTAVATVPSWITNASVDIQYTGLTGTLYKKNGVVYGTTQGYSACSSNSDAQMGSIISIDSASHAFSYIYPFACDVNDGLLPWHGNLEDVNGDLYGYTYWGGTAAFYPNNGYGTIFKYSPSLNTFSKEHDFISGSTGYFPTGHLVRANNGKLYGTAGGGLPVNGSQNGAGVLYEFDPATQSYSVKVNFNQNYASGVGLFGSLWLNSSLNGKLYGTTSYGVFEYNTVTGLTRAASRFSNPNTASSTGLIEICAKPSYAARAARDYTICEGSFFSYDLKSDNALTYIWKQNNIAVSSQTNSILSFSAIAQSDGGSWICVMTNACGTTTAGAVTLTVNSSGAGVVTSTISASAGTMICPGSSITLSGNTNGSWSTGSASSSITVSQPGTYQVVNTNTCGNTFSNIIKIDTLPAPAVQIITFTNTFSNIYLSYAFCQGDSVQLTGNTNGTWNTGETSPSIFVKDTLLHYVISSTTCHAVYSATAQAHFVPVPKAPVISSAGPLHVCAGDSVLLTTDSTLSFNWYIYYSAFNFSTYAGYGNTLYAKQSGLYYTVQTPYCGAVYSQSVQIEISGTALDTAVITAMGPLAFCPGGSVALVSSYSTCVWNTGATTESILVTQPGPYWVINTNACSSAKSATINVTHNTVPPVVYSEIQSSVCIGTPAFSLSPGTPSGGTYSGAGVSGNIFSPSVAGSGFKTINYQYQDPLTGCVGTASQVIFVEPTPTITAASSLTFCAGRSVLLIQLNNPLCTWNTGSSSLTNSVTQSGAYYVTTTNLCGQAVSSNTINVLVNPQPTLVANSATLCSGQSVALTASGAVSYTWSNAHTNGNAVSPLTTQVYTVVGSDSFGCRDTIETTIYVNQSPTVSVASGTICEGGSFVLNPIGAVNYTFSSATATVSPLITSNYTVHGADANGCLNSNVAVATVSVFAAPVLSVSSGSICLGETFDMQPSGASSYTFSGNSATVSPLTTTNYTVTGSGSEGCISLSPVVATVSVMQLPTVTVNSGTICEGQTFTIVPSGAASYVVQGGSSFVSPILNTTYTVTGTNTEGCASASVAVASVSVYAKPLISVSGGSVCSGQTFTLSPSGATSYSFQGGSSVVSPVVNTTYTVSGWSPQGCFGVSAVPASITVHALPLITVNGASICSGQSFVLNPAGAATYSYSGGSATVSPLVTTSYSVTGTSMQGCSSTLAAVANVVVSPSPTISVNSGTICQGQTFTIQPTGAFTYTYQNGTPIVNPLVNSTYTVTGTSAFGCPSASVAVASVTVYPNPNLAVNNPALCLGELFVMQASGASTYTWNTGATSSSISVIATIAASYSLNASSAMGCQSFTAVALSVSECVGLSKNSIQDNSIVLYPDPTQGEFTVDISENSSVSISNSVGQVIFKGELTAGKNQINLNEQKNGIYFVQVTTGAKTKTLKLIKH